MTDLRTYFEGYDAAKLEAADELSALRERVEALEGAWQPIGSCEATGKGNSVLVAVTHAERESVVGEAWRDEDGEWWWANTDYGDYYADPISQINYGRVSHWRPLPDPPVRAHLLTQESDNG